MAQVNSARKVSTSNGSHSSAQVHLVSRLTTQMLDQIIQAKITRQFSLLFLQINNSERKTKSGRTCLGTKEALPACWSMLVCGWAARAQSLSLPYSKKKACPWAASSCLPAAPRGLLVTWATSHGLCTPRLGSRVRVGRSCAACPGLARSHASACAAPSAPRAPPSAVRRRALANGKTKKLLNFVCKSKI